MQIIVRHSGADIPIENLSLSEAVIIRKKSATDEFRAKFTDPAGAKPFSTGETIEIYSDGIRKFRGALRGSTQLSAAMTTLFQWPRKGRGSTLKA